MISIKSMLYLRCIQLTLLSLQSILADEKFAAIAFESDAAGTIPADTKNDDDMTPGSPLALMARDTGTRLAGHVE